MTRKNLLEAFRRSDESPGGTPPPRAPTDAPPARGRPPGVPRAARGPLVPLAVLAVVLAFALGFVAGRRAPVEAAPADPASAPASARAGDPPASQPRAFRPPPAPAGAGEAAAPERIEDSALFDARNLYTVAVASYGKNHPDLAWATHAHLKEAGLPVFPPIESGNMLAIFVGAAPTLAELAETEATIKKLTRDGKQAAYGDAYRARIDKLIPRKTAERDDP